MKQFFIYWVWPNPAGWYYTDLKVLAILGGALLLVVASFLVSVWRGRVRNPQTKVLSASWSSALFWFGLVAFFLVICRVEMIQFMAMRLLWLLWIVAAGFYIFFQVLQFRRRHYTVVSRTRVFDERDRYLP